MVSALTVQNADLSRVLLTWKLSGKLPDFFSIERSTDGRQFEVVTVLNNVAVQKQYQWTDEAPEAGRNFYRIRYAFKEGQSLYSSTATTVVAGRASYRFYPNPVSEILIVRSESPVDVQVSDATGKIRVAQQRVQGLQTINVGALEKGIYLIRFSNKLTNVMFQEKLIKN